LWDPLRCLFVSLIFALRPCPRCRLHGRQRRYSMCSLIPLTGPALDVPCLMEQLNARGLGRGVKGLTAASPPVYWPEPQFACISFLADRTFSGPLRTLSQGAAIAPNPTTTETVQPSPSDWPKPSTIPEPLITSPRWPRNFGYTSERLEQTIETCVPF